MIEYFTAINWTSILITYGVFIVGMVIGVCIGFSAGRRLTIEKITEHVREKSKSRQGE